MRVQGVELLEIVELGLASVDLATLGGIGDRVGAGAGAAALDLDVVTVAFDLEVAVAGLQALYAA